MLKVALKINFMSSLLYSACIFLNLHFFKDFKNYKSLNNKSPKNIWSIMLSSSLYAMLTMSKTTSLQKLFTYESIKLYISFPSFYLCLIRKLLLNYRL